MIYFLLFRDVDLSMQDGVVLVQDSCWPLAWLSGEFEWVEGSGHVLIQKVQKLLVVLPRVPKNVITMYN